jgi:uncharacterized protein (TIGR04255 family)
MPASADELFPPSSRVIYGKAPLIQVICQLRFPSLLSIESQPPADFQERIRNRFPLLERGRSDLPADLPQEVLQAIGAQIPAVEYRFLTEDRVSTVTLTPQSLALSTNRYERWEHFLGQLRAPLTALNEIYKPSFFSRVGLRYTDVIDRERLGLQNTPWSRLLNPHILGELELPQFENWLDKIANRTIRVKIPDGSGSVLMRHGLGNVQGRKEICYTIDFDFSTEPKTEVQDAEAILNHFNAMAGWAFRWCITDTLRNALNPVDLAG